MLKRFLVCVIILLVLTPSPVLALSCQVSASPKTISNQATTSISFSVTNDGPESVGYVRINNPDDAFFSVAGGSASGWSLGDLSVPTFSGGSLTAAQSGSFNLSLSALQETSSPLSFEIEISADGGAYTGCSGDTAVTIEPASEGSALSIGSVTISAADTSAVITWTTSSPANSLINYGLTTSYGSQVDNSSLSTSHSLTPTGLSASTTYYYRISGTDANGVSVQYANSFTTAAAGATTTVTTTVTNTTTNTVTKTVEVKDTTPPSVLLTGLDKKVYTKPPEISGTISDAYGVLEVEYSLDEGKNWAKVAMDGERGDKKSKFTFEPDVSADGTYATLIRGIDISGNKSSGKEITFVLDQLDPAIGPGMFQMGLLPIYPDGGGTLHVPLNTDILVVVPEIGGSDKIELGIGDKKYALKKEPASGLWKGVFRLENKEKKTITAQAVDGAGNTTKRDLVKVEGEGMGMVVNDEGVGIKDVELTVYVYDQDKKDYKVWDGLSRGIANPMKTDEGGNFGFYLPSGKYFLKLTKKDLGTLRTAIFETNGFEVVNPKIIFGKNFSNWWWTILSGIDIWPEVSVEMRRPSPSVNSSLSSLFPIDDLLHDSTKVSGEEKIYLIGNSSLPLPLIDGKLIYVGFFEGLSRVKSFLGKSGVEVAMAHDGEEGWEKLKKEKPTIALFDIMMPKLNGLQLLDRVKDDTELKKIPVIMLTNLAGQSDAEKALEKGAIKYIVKSEHEPKEIAAMVKEIIKGYTRDEVPGK